MYITARTITASAIILSLACFLSVNATIIDDVLQVPMTIEAPEIDGEMDDCWMTITHTPMFVYVDDIMPEGGWLDHSSWFRVMYDDDAFYFFGRVYDDEIAVDSPNDYENDSWELYIDAENLKNNTYISGNDYQWRYVYGESDPFPIGEGEGEWMETDYGYDFELVIDASDIPFALEAGHVFGWETQVNERDSGIRQTMSKWNSNSNDSWLNPSLFGTAELTARQTSSILDVPMTAAAPVIDGDMENTWLIAPEISMNTYSDQDLDMLSGRDDLDFTYRVMWNTNGFYFFGSVKDDEIETDSPNDYENDSFEIYFDAENLKEYTYIYENDFQWRYVYGEAPPYPAGKGTGEWMETNDGYDFELKIDAADVPFVLEANHVFGFEVQVNDRENGGRESIGKWWSASNDSWIDPSLFGTAELIISTGGQPPAVTTENASNIGMNSATLNGTVNPQGYSTTVSFEYGPTTSYGSIVQASQSPVSGTGNVSVSAQIGSLTQLTTYYYRTVATNSNGTTQGTAKSFTTLDPSSIPDINVTPVSFNEQIPYGSSLAKTLTIQNTGSGLLQWSIPMGFDSTSSQHYGNYGASTIHTFQTGLVSGEATLTVTLNGDFDDYSEYAEVMIEGTNLGEIIDNDVSNGTDIVASYTLSGTDMANWTSDGSLEVTVDNSYEVNYGNGGDETHTVRLEIEGFSGWLSLSKSSGMLSAGQSEAVSVTFNTTGLDIGIYTDDMEIESNDPDEPVVTVPVALNILGPSISVNPTQISRNLIEGNSQTSLLTISNGGPGLLEFDIQMTTQAPSTAIYALQKNARMGIEAAVDNIIRRSGILNHELRVTSVDQETGEEKESVCSSPEQLANIKYADTANNSELDVAVLGAADQQRVNDVQSKLLLTNEFNSVTIFDVRYMNPSVIELQAFDAVLVFRNNLWYDEVELGNNLADYIDQGGGVVSMLFEVAGSNALSGRWYSEEYYVIERDDNDVRDSRATLGQVFEPNHPIMQGVASFDGGTSSFRPYTTNLTTGATLVANWSDGKPLVAVKTIGNVNRVDLGFYPVSSDVSSNFWQTGTDGDILMANALVYTAGGSVSWCEVDPSSGTVQSGSYEQVNVTFDATAIDQGAYQGYLLIENNDSNNQGLNIPLTLNVTDNVAPGTVSDLALESVTANFATLSWTAPGDNGTLGTADSYDLRYATQAITEANWASATEVTDTLPVPLSPGTQQSVRISNLTASTTYYFGLKTKDEANHYSALSNILQIKTTEEVDGLIYFPFEEESGDIAMNYQGDTDFNGDLNYFDDLSARDVATNSGWTQFGYKGNALKFDGINDYVSIPDYSGSPLHLNTALTLKMAIKSRNDILPTGTFDFYEIISKINSSSGYALRFNLENGRLRFLIQFGSTNVGIYESSQSSWAGGEWYEIMVTFDYNSPSDNVKIYINNQLDASYDETRLLSINDEDIEIGGGNTYSWEFPGTIDEVLIHNQVLQPTDVEAIQTAVIPKAFTISQNYPNPFNPTTTIHYALPKKELVVIKIFNINGYEVKTLFEQEQSPGEHTITWDGRDDRSRLLPSGIYLYQIKAGPFHKTFKMSLIK